jgi:hypothetical protein
MDYFSGGNSNFPQKEQNRKAEDKRLLARKIRLAAAIFAACSPGERRQRGRVRISGGRSRGLANKSAIR